MTPALGRRALILGLGGTALACARRDEFPERKTASFWFSYGGRNREVLEDLARRFNASQTHHAIRPVFQGDYHEGLAKLRTALAAGVPPGLTHVVGEVVPYLYEAGTLEPLDDYPGAHELGLVPALSQAGAWVGGGDRPLVALPFNRSTPIAYFDAALMSALGLRPPKTWDELIEVARALTLRDGGRVKRYGFSSPVGWWFWAALVGQAGGSIVEADGRVSLGGHAGERALALWQRLVHDEGTMKLPLGRDYDAWEAVNRDYLSGRTAMIWTSTAFLRYLEDNAAFPVLAAPLPADRRAAVPTGGTYFVVPRGAPPDEKEAAYAFVRFMLEDDQTIEWSTRTGYMPVTLSAIERLRRSGHYERHPNAAVTLTQLEDAFPWPWSPDLFRLEREIIRPLIEDTVLENRPPAAALEEGRRRIAARRRP
jgi:sn-glycerol 3-phosphate transport system substrate-binding protein